MLRSLCALVFAAAILSGPGLALPGAESPPPASPPAVSPEAESAARLFDSLYGADVKLAEASRDPADDLALAGRLLEAAKAAEANLPLLTLLCDAACRLGLKDARGDDVVLAAADLLASNVAAKGPACAAYVQSVRQRQFVKARGEERIAAGEALMDSHVEAAGTMAREGDFEEALAAGRAALKVAGAIRSPNAAGITAYLRRLVDQQKVAGRVPALKDKVAADPADRASRDELVRLLLVELDNPEAAAAYIDDACGEDLRRYGPAAAKGVDAAPEAACPMLAAWYLGLSKDASPGGKALMLMHAKAYCERFLAVHPKEDAERAMAAVTLAKVEADLKALGPAAWTPPVKMVGAGQWVDLLKMIDPVQDSVAGTWAFKEGALVPQQRAPSGPPRCQAPLALLGDYEVEIKFSGRGNEFGIILPLGKAWTVLSIVSSGEGRHRYAVGCPRDENLQKCGGKPVVVEGPHLERDRTYTLLVRVRTARGLTRVEVALDGGAICVWSGDPAQLTVFPRYAPPNPACLGFSDDYYTIQIKAARLRMLSGQAVPLRRPQEDQTASTPAP
jgi:tetratricopeptide (TPR) repeat protein